MPKRRAEDDEWDLHRDVIIQLYINEDRTLPDVMETMAARGLKRTKAQWGRILKKWALAKNATKEEWKFIFSRLSEREADNKVSTVNVRGIILPESRIKKQRRIHDYQTTFDRCTKGLQPLERLATPPGVSIFTPKPSPSPSVDAPTQDINRPAALEYPASGVTALVQLRDSPWQQFIRSIRSWSTSGSTTQPYSPRHLEHGECIQSDVHYVGKINHLPNPYPARALRGEGGIMLARFLNFENRLHPIFFDQRPYLPRDQSGVIDVEHDPYDLIEVNTYLETLKFIVVAVANNFGLDSMEQLMSELARSVSAVSVLQRLIRQRLVAVKACAEKLLIPAVLQRNLSLVRILVESGVDVNIDAYKVLEDKTVTALQCAVELGDESITATLLENGTTDWAIESSSGTYYDGEVSHGELSVLDLAVEQKDYNMVERLLAHRAHLENGPAKVSLRTLRRAVLSGHIELVELFIDRLPELLNDAKAAPWLLLEAAATCEGMAMFDILIHIGLDIYATNESGKGSVLVSAFANGNSDLLRHLLRADATINGRAFGLGRNIANAYRSEAKLQGLYGMGALHVAVRNNDEDMVRLLLNRGADPNQCCQLYPIQLAAWNGDQNIVELLVENHARVDAKRHGGRDVHHFWLHDFKPEQVNSASKYASYTAICIAYVIGYVDIINALYRVGARLPLYDPGHSFYANYDPLPLITVDIVWFWDSSKWDPLAIAIEKKNGDFLSDVVHQGYMDPLMTTRHMARCVCIYGSDFTQKLIKRDLLALDIAVQPVVLWAAVWKGKGEEIFVGRLVTKLIDIFGHKDFARLYGPTALKIAVVASQTSLVRLFLNAGVSPYERDPEIPDKDSWRPSFWYLNVHEWACSTAFEAAWHSESIHLIDMFLLWHRATVDPEQQAFQKRQLSTAYINSVCSGNKKLENMILKTGLGILDIYQTLGSYHTDLHLHVGLQRAVQQEDYNTVERLLDLGADPNRLKVRKDDFILRDTALQCAAQNDKVCLVKKLLEKGADVNAEPDPNFGATALQYAAINGNFEIFNVLLRAGADVNACAAYEGGRTAIEGAAEWGRLDMTSYLLQLGADIRGRTNANYRRTVYRAWKNGHRTLVRMLQSWKSEKYGPEDCEDVDTVMMTVTSDELEYGNDEAKQRYEYYYDRPDSESYSDAESETMSDTSHIMNEKEKERVAESDHEMLDETHDIFSDLVADEWFIS